MASVSIAHAAQARLAALRHVTVLDHPAPRDPDLVALVFAGIRVAELRRAPAGHAARVHLRLGEWLDLVEDTDEDVACAAIALFLDRVAAVPAAYTAAGDEAERAAAAQVRAACALPMTLAA
ncbi:hypothetical protein [Roseicella frigidaeris]|uniref:Uncharacterized protein n=1 Tax=Roseicella frigidaeris TaxID=2230885 RepID=A0A327M0G1_9PROT|nr:hypothetical protein [Roseicella frigidaeris]RAI55907.1 hypothetical protein DOO78_23445 [Roseicella frigidaeris]